MNNKSNMYIPERKIDFLLDGQRPRSGYLAFALEEIFHFSTEGLESYSFSRWSPLVFDAMVVAAASGALLVVIVDNVGFVLPACYGA